MVATGFVEHLSVHPAMAPLCNQHVWRGWVFFEVRNPRLPLCRKCRGMLLRLNDLAA